MQRERGREGVGGGKIEIVLKYASTAANINCQTKLEPLFKVCDQKKDVGPRARNRYQHLSPMKNTDATSCKYFSLY